MLIYLYNNLIPVSLNLQFCSSSAFSFHASLIDYYNITILCSINYLQYDYVSTVFKYLPTFLSLFWYTISLTLSLIIYSFENSYYKIYCCFFDFLFFIFALRDILFK